LGRLGGQGLGDAFATGYYHGFWVRFCGRTPATHEREQNDNQHKAH